jgi:hypothetical protein
MSPTDQLHEGWQKCRMTSFDNAFKVQWELFCGMSRSMSCFRGPQGRGKGVQLAGWPEELARTKWVDVPRFDAGHR